MRCADNHACVKRVLGAATNVACLRSDSRTNVSRFYYVSRALAFRPLHSCENCRAQRTRLARIHGVADFVGTHCVVYGPGLSKQLPRQSLALSDIPMQFLSGETAWGRAH